MEVVLGLDVSTSVIGWSIVSADANIGDQPLDMGHIKLAQIKDFWEKVDYTKKAIEDLVDDLFQQGYDIKLFAVEDAVKKFQRGKSTAHTIALLSKFNVIVSYFGRQELDMDPLYIDCSQARKLLGVTLLSRKKADGKSQKQQTFDHLDKTVFESKTWPMTKHGNIYAYCYDEVDAYVVAMAGALS